MLARLQVGEASWCQQQMHSHNLQEPELQALPTNINVCTHASFVRIHLIYAASRTPSPQEAWKAASLQASGQLASPAGEANVLPSHT
jgi:hypothetical protein